MAIRWWRVTWIVFVFAQAGDWLTTWWALTHGMANESIWLTHLLWRQGGAIGYLLIKTSFIVLLYWGGEHIVVHRVIPQRLAWISFLSAVTLVDLIMGWVVLQNLRILLIAAS